MRDQLNQGKTCAVLTTDISAGFNLVSKEILIPKMSKFGFGEKSCQLLSNYLTGRRTKTKVKNILSSDGEVETGVGEGSLLGPNFFSCGTRLKPTTTLSKCPQRLLRYQRPA